MPRMPSTRWFGMGLRGAGRRGGPGGGGRRGGRGGGIQELESEVVVSRWQWDIVIRKGREV